jgi:hypothetical protein
LVVCRDRPCHPNSPRLAEPADSQKSKQTARRERYGPACSNKASPAARAGSSERDPELVHGRQVHPVNVKMNDVELTRPLGEKLQWHCLRNDRIDTRSAEPQSRRPPEQESPWLANRRWRIVSRCGPARRDLRSARTPLSQCRRRILVARFRPTELPGQYASRSSDVRTRAHKKRAFRDHSSFIIAEMQKTDRQINWHPKVHLGSRPPAYNACGFSTESSCARLSVLQRFRRPMLMALA